jgi:hypothetical protein
MNKFDLLVEQVLSKDTLTKDHIKMIKSVKWTKGKLGKGRNLYVFDSDDKEVAVYKKFEGNEKPWVLTYADHYEQDYGFMQFDSEEDLKDFAKKELKLDIK